MYRTNMTGTKNRRIIEQKGNVTIFEYERDLSVNPGSAMQSYYASQMNIRKRQVMIELNKEHQAIIQAGAMQ